MTRTDLYNLPLNLLTFSCWTFFIEIGTAHFDSDHTAMTKRFHTYKSTQKCDEKQATCFSQALKNKGEEISLLEAIKSEKEHLARHILLEKQFSNLEIQDKRRDGNYEHFHSFFFVVLQKHRIF